MSMIISTLAAGEANQFGGIIPIIIMFVVMWVILIRPQQKRQKELSQRVAAMKKGDKVITAGGIHGIVHSIGEHTVSLKVAEGINVEFDKTAIASIPSAEKAAQKGAKK